MSPCCGKDSRAQHNWRPSYATKWARNTATIFQKALLDDVLLSRQLEEYYRAPKMPLRTCGHLVKLVKHSILDNVRLSQHVE